MKTLTLAILAFALTACGAATVPEGGLAISARSAALEARTDITRGGVFSPNVETVLSLRLNEIMRDHGVEQRTAHLYAVSVQHHVVVLDVLTGFRGIPFERWSKDVQHLLSARPVRHGCWDIPSGSRLPRKGKPHQ